MAGLGLINAVNAFQQGTAWKQQQAEIARAQEQRAALDEANAAATGVIQQSQAEWAANGAQGQYRPSESTMFKAAEARGMALAQRGRWDEFIQNEAQVAPLRVKARATALQKYELDGDAEALARTVYPTLFDGKEIVGTEKVIGGEGLKGAPSGPTMLRLKLSDGSTKMLAPDEIVKMVKTSLIDPQTAMKNEAMLNLERMKAEIDAAAKTKVERVKGEEARKTEDQKSASAAGLESMKAEKQLALADRQGERAREVANIHAGATLGAARIGADSRVAAAEKTASGAAPGKADRLYDQLHDEAIKVYGDRVNGPLGGNRIANEHTQAMARYAADLKAANPELSVSEVIRQSSEAWKKSAAGRKWAKENGG